MIYTTHYLKKGYKVVVQKISVPDSTSRRFPRNMKWNSQVSASPVGQVGGRVESIRWSQF